jgi:hypothetical protein
MATSCCSDILIEVTCPPVETGGGGVVWFQCAYSGCHGGVGHVKVYANLDPALGIANGEEKVHDSCPYASSSKLAWVNFDPTKVNAFGGRMTVNYGEPGCACCGHGCNGALFNWGFHDNTTTPKGQADLNNGGSGGPRFNTFNFAPLEMPLIVPATPDPTLNGGGVQKKRCYRLGNSCGTNASISSITTILKEADRITSIASVGYHPVQITTFTPTTIVSGQRVTISGVMSNNTCKLSTVGNGTFVVLSVQSPNQFTYANLSSTHGVNDVYRLEPSGCIANSTSGNILNGTLMPIVNF